MAKVELKTKPTEQSVAEYLRTYPDEKQRADGEALLEIFKEVTKHEPKMWGDSIIGFGQTTLKYSTGRELDWLVVGYALRKGKISLYLTVDATKFEELPQLGKVQHGKGCIYLKRLSDIDTNVLRSMIAKVVADYKEHWSVHE